MAHVTQDTTWCTIDIDTTAGQIVVQERWQYVWLLHSPRMTRWTLNERQRFHAQAEAAIWNAWSNRAFLRVEGTSEFAKRFSGREIPVFMDIRWVLAKPHWTVKVTKVPADVVRLSRVEWGVRVVTLDTNDFATRQECFGLTREICVRQVPVAHEFGHTIGNIGSIHREREDEYKLTSPYVADFHSIMHRGNQLRERHFEHLLTELYELIPDTVFTMGRIQ